ncbi:22722_t:CDS:2, partial [Gigaspora rosea]
MRGTKNTPDWIINSEELGGIKFLADEVVARQIKTVYTNLNRNDPIGEAVEARVMQGCLKARLTEDIWVASELNKYKGLWKDNFACRVLIEAKKKGLSFSRSESLWKVNGEGATFTESLGEKELKKAIRSLQNLGLFYINQIISTDGKRLLSWQRLKSGRKVAKRGRVADWYKILQNQLVDKSSSRPNLRPEYIARNPNSLSIILQKDNISVDKRRKEWICWNSEAGKLIGRIERKSNATFVLEHWQEKKDSDLSLGLLSRCSGCSDSTNSRRGLPLKCQIKRKFCANGTVIP